MWLFPNVIKPNLQDRVTTPLGLLWTGTRNFSSAVTKMILTA